MKKKKWADAVAADLETPIVEEDEPTNGRRKPTKESRSITLKSGGTLTLFATTKFMALNTADRAFVFSLIDQLLEYEKQNSQVDGPAPA